MAIPENKATENDMTESGRFCFADGNQLEKVTGEERYSCHYCGGTYTYEEYKNAKEDGRVADIGIWFKGH